MVASDAEVNAGVGLAAVVVGVEVGVEGVTLSLFFEQELNIESADNNTTDAPTPARVLIFNNFIIVKLIRPI